MNIEIANRLVQLRKQHGLSQEELAAKLGLSRQAVSKWERAEASPDTDNLILLSRVYGVSVDELLRTEDPIPEPEPDRGVKLTVNGKPIKFETKDGFYFTYGDDEEEYKQEREHAAEGKCDCDNVNVRITRENDDKHHDKSFFLMFPYPIFITILYLCLGFVWDLWHPGWILFITIPAYYSIVHYFTGSRRHSFFKAFPYVFFVVCAFLLLGCVWNLWHPAWVLFLTIPVYYPIAETADRRYRRRRAKAGIIDVTPDDDDDDDDDD